MGKRKRPADVNAVQYEQAPSRGRIVQTVQDKAGILYIQNDSATSTSAISQQKQQSGQQSQTTYYQIQTKVQDSTGTGSVIQEHRTGGQTHQTQVVHQQTQQQQYASTDDNVTFKCIKCEQIFESKAVFMEHCNQFHYFACDLCTNCIFDDLYQLNVHMIKHINKYDMCEKCNMLCNSTEELKAHLGGHITTYNKNEVILTSNGQTNALNDDSLIEHLASELDQSIGNTVKVKPQKYRCGVCKQDFSDPKILFKHMNQVHINFQTTQVIQQQSQSHQVANPSPPPNQPTATTVQIAQQQSSQPTTIQENVVYANIDSNNIYYDERTGQYYTIALMDNASPLSEAGGSGQSVIEYVQDTSSLQQVQQHIEYIEDGHQGQETIIIEDESQNSQQHLQSHNKPSHSTIQQTIIQQPIQQQQVISSHSKHEINLTPQHKNSSAASSGPTTTTTLSTDPPPLVQITRDTDLEELIPTTTLVADAPTQKVSNKHEPTSAVNNKQTGVTKCEICQTSFVKKLPKQMYCHNCVTRNTTAAAAAASKH